MDVNYPVSQIVYEGYNDEPRLKTSFPHRSLFEAGRLGRKTGRGNYRYENGKPVDVPSPDYQTDAAPTKGVILVEPDEALEAFAAEAGWTLLDDNDGTCPLIGYPQGEDCTAFALFGIAYAWFLARREHTPDYPLIAISVFVPLELGFVAATRVLVPGVAEVLGHGFIVTGNVFAALLMAFYLRRGQRHPDDSKAADA